MLLSVCAFWCSSGTRIKKKNALNWHIMQESDYWFDVDGVIKTELFEECIAILLVSVI